MMARPELAVIDQGTRVRPGSLEHMLQKGDLVALCRPIPSTGTSSNASSIKRRRKDQKLKGVNCAYRHIDEGIRTRKKRQIASVKGGSEFTVEFLKIHMQTSYEDDNEEEELEEQVIAHRRKRQKVTWDMLTTAQQTDVLQSINDRLNSTRRAFRKQIRELYREASEELKRQVYQLEDDEEIPVVTTDPEEEVIPVAPNKRKV